MSHKKGIQQIHFDFVIIEYKMKISLSSWKINFHFYMGECYVYIRSVYNIVTFSVVRMYRCVYNGLSNTHVHHPQSHEYMNIAAWRTLYVCVNHIRMKINGKYRRKSSVYIWFLHYNEHTVANSQWYRIE